MGAVEPKCERGFPLWSLLMPRAKFVDQQFIGIKPSILIKLRDCSVWKPLADPVAAVEMCFGFLVSNQTKILFVYGGIDLLH